MLKETKDRYHNACGKEKAAEYYRDNQNVFRENAIN